jgi:hypothetical protein
MKKLWSKTWKKLLQKGKGDLPKPWLRRKQTSNPLVGFEIEE